MSMYCGNIGAPQYHYNDAWLTNIGNCYWEIIKIDQFICGKILRF